MHVERGTTIYKFTQAGSNKDIILDMAELDHCVLVDHSK